MAKLTQQQRRFVQILHSMKKRNVGKAWELAGSTCRGETARVEGHRTLQKPHVAAYLAKLQKKSEERAVKKADDIIRELEKMGFSNIKDYIEVVGDKIVMKALTDMSDEQLAAIAEISETTTQHGGTVKFKLHDKFSALKALGLRFGIFPTKVEHTGELTLAQAVHKAMTEKEK